MRFLLGGYTADMAGAAAGIGVLQAGAVDDVLAGGPLAFTGGAVATGGSPSWLAWHPTLDVLYAALEADGTVQAFRRTGETAFTPLGAPAPAGEAVCHVAVAPDGGSLVAACWGDGRVVRVALGADGALSAPVIAEAAADPYGSGGARVPTDEADDLAAAVRALRAAAGEEFAGLVPGFGADEPPAPVIAADDERVSRAHHTRFLPDGSLVTTDIGFDLVRVWRTTDGRLRERGRVVLPRGAGPRHTLWHPSGHLYVVTEHSGELFALAPDAGGTWRVVAGTPLAPGLLAGDAAAEIALSRDGRFVYAGVRGTDLIATVAVGGSGAQLSPIALVEAGVTWPRHHIVARDTLLVAGQHSHDVASLTLDERTGVPGRLRHRAGAPSPTCLLPLPA